MYKAWLVIGLTPLIALGCGTISNTLDCDVNPPFRYLASPDAEGRYQPYSITCPLWRQSEENQKQVYGGFLKDLNIWELRNYTHILYSEDPMLAVLDMPLSIIGDTITLPYILAYKNGWLGTKPSQSARQPYEIP
jgi:uncharacterized protein YceK